MIKVAPSVLSADFANLAGALDDLEAWGADMVHCDVMDGVFVPNMSMGQPVVAAMRKRTSLPLDVHLMIVNPEKFVSSFAEAGADIITIHVEATNHVHRAIQQIKAAGVKAGVVLNPHTPLCMIEHIIEDVDMVLLMSVNPGFGGQKFIPQVRGKASALKEMCVKRGLDIDIEIDGGVTPENAQSLREAGVNVLVAGNAVFKAQDPAAAVRAIRGQ